MSGIVQHFDSGLGSEVTVESYSRNRGLKCVQSSGRLQDAVLRGRCFVAGTAVTGVAPTGTIGTTAEAAITNPFGSGVMVSLWRLVLGYISGTIAVGPIHLCVNSDTSAAAATGAATEPTTNCNLSGGYSNKAKFFTTATLPATPTLVKPLFNLTPMDATGAFTPWQLKYRFDGEFVLMPGCTASFQSTCGAGTSPLVCYGLTWEEIPLG